MPLHAKPAAIVMRSDLISSDAIAKRLASAGYNVVIPFYRDCAAANRTVSEIEAKGGTAVALFADIENDAHVDAVFKTTVSVFGRCDLVVNEAERLTQITVENHAHASRGLHMSARSSRENNVSQIVSASVLGSVEDGTRFFGDGQELRRLQ